MECSIESDSNGVTFELLSFALGSGHPRESCSSSGCELS